MIDWHVWKGHFLTFTWEVRLHQKKARRSGGHCRVSKLGMCLVIASMEHTRSPKSYVPSLRTASTLPGKHEAKRQGQLFTQSFTLCKFMTCDFIIPRCYVPHCTHNSKAKLLEASLPTTHSVRVSGLRFQLPHWVSFTSLSLTFTISSHPRFFTFYRTPLGPPVPDPTSWSSSYWSMCPITTIVLAFSRKTMIAYNVSNRLIVLSLNLQRLLFCFFLFVNIPHLPQ
jgi:hypothetical protein